MLSKQEIVEKFAILDIEAWATSSGATFGKGYEHTGYFNRKHFEKRRTEAQGDLN
jgi:hypothetical protein